MTDRAKIFTIYGTVAVLSALIIGGAIFLGSRVPDQQLSDFVSVGVEKVDKFFPISKDLSGINQAGEAVSLSDLKGKVWIVTEFFAVCPHCSLRNVQELQALHEEFKDHPDFHMVCVSVDPETDTQERLAEYSETYGADAADWWFFRHPDEKGTHDYMENTLGFFGIRERKDPLEISINGRFAHDLGIMLVDREWNVIGKWPLADARSDEARARDPHYYEHLKKDLYDRIHAELEKNETAGIDGLPLDEAEEDAPADHE